MAGQNRRTLVYKVILKFDTNNNFVTQIILTQTNIDYAYKLVQMVILK